MSDIVTSSSFSLAEIAGAFQQQTPTLTVFVILFVMMLKMKHDMKEALSKIDNRFEKMDARMDLGFAQVDKKMDLGFAQMDAKIDLRFAQMEKKMDHGFAGADARLKAIDDLKLKEELKEINHQIVTIKFTLKDIDHRLKEHDLQINLQQKQAG